MQQVTYFQSTIHRFLVQASLNDIKIEYNIVSKGKEVWGIMSFINNPQIAYYPENGVANIDFDVPHQIINLIENPEQSCFAPIDLIVVKGLRNKYSIALYELVKDYYKIESKKFIISDFKRLIGSTDKYTKFNMFAKRVLDPAVEDVNKNTDMNVEYRIERIGRRISNVVLIMGRSNKGQEFVPQIETKKTEEQERQIEKLAEQDEPDCETINKMIDIGITESQARKWMKDYGEEYILKNIETINNKIAGGYEVHNKASFLNKSLQDNYSYKSPEQKEKDDKEESKNILKDKIDRFEQWRFHGLKREDLETLQEEIALMYDGINPIISEQWRNKDIDWIMH